jgi:hypothetical protein
MHKRLAVVALALALSAAPLFAQQSPNTTPGAVTRIVLIRVKSGHGDQFWADFRQHLKPIYDEEKRQGILTDWHTFTKATLENENDWGVGLSLTYANWAALDNLGPRTDPITLAHYGSPANRTAAGNARSEHGTVVSSFLIRDQTVNPWK